MRLRPYFSRNYGFEIYRQKTPSEIFQRTFRAVFIAFPEFGKVWEKVNRI